MTIPANTLYLTVEQVAQRFGVSKDTIFRWRRAGEFPAAVKLGGNTVRWRLSDIEAYEAQLSTCLVTGLDFEPDALLAR